MKKTNKLHNIRLLLGITLCLLVLTSITTVTGSGYQNVSVQEAKNLVDSNPALFILDVRTTSEFLEGHLANATLISYDQITENINRLPEENNSEILVYCRSGSRSGIASNTLVGLGYSNVSNMLEGIQGWIAAGYPVTIGNSTSLTTSNVGLGSCTLTIIGSTTTGIIFLTRKKKKAK